MLTTLMSWACACLLLAAGAVHGAEMAAPKGALVIIGGALRGDNAPVWTRIVQLAGGKGARIAVFASAAAQPERAGPLNAERLRSFGADAFVVPVAVKLAGADYAAAADDPALAALVRAAGGAYFAGGDQGRITQALRRPDGSNTLVLDALWEMYRRGGVIAGTSAGAAIMSSTMFLNAPPVLAVLQSGVESGGVLARGLGFIGDDIFVDQHLLVRGRFARMLPAMLQRGYQLGLGVDENTAVIVAGRQIEVLGYSGALLVDLSKAVAGSGDFNVRNVQLSYLDSGDRADLASGAVTPSDDKAGGRVDPAHPALRGPLFSADILGNMAVVDLMARLIDSAEPEAVGLAFAPAPGAAHSTGFEFKFRRGAGSAGYASASSARYSIYKVWLDIRPVRIAQPFYEQAGGPR